MTRLSGSTVTQKLQGQIVLHLVICLYEKKEKETLQTLNLIQCDRAEPFDLF